MDILARKMKKKKNIHDIDDDMKGKLYTKYAKPITNLQNRTVKGNYNQKCYPKMMQTTSIVV